MTFFYDYEREIEIETEDGNLFEITFGSITLDYHPAETEVGVFNDFWQIVCYEISLVRVWIDEGSYYAIFHIDQFEIIYETEINSFLSEFSENYENDMDWLH